MDLQYNLRRDVARELKLDQDTVERITRSLFEFVAHTMEEKQLGAVRLPYFGLFSCKPVRVQKLIERGSIAPELAKNIPGLENVVISTPNPLAHGIGLP